MSAYPSSSSHILPSAHPLFKEGDLVAVQSGQGGICGYGVVISIMIRLTDIYTNAYNHEIEVHVFYSQRHFVDNGSIYPPLDCTGYRTLYCPERGQIRRLTTREMTTLLDLSDTVRDEKFWSTPVIAEDDIDPSFDAAVKSVGLDERCSDHWPRINDMFPLFS